MNMDVNTIQKKSSLKQKTSYIMRTVYIAATGFLLGCYPLNTEAQIANLDWAKGVGGTNYDQGNSVAADAIGNVFITGYISSSGANMNPGGPGGTLTSAGGNDAFISKYAPSGSFLWAKSIGGTGGDVGRGVATDAAGNVFVTGHFPSAGADMNPGGSGGLISSAGDFDVFLAKYSPTGSFLWVKSMGGTGTDQGLKVATDATGNVYVTGFFNGTANFNLGGTGGSLTTTGNNDAFVAKYSPTGTFLWAKNMGGTGTDQGLNIATDATGNVYVTGIFNATANFNLGGTGGSLTSAGSSDAYVVKYNSAGTFQWAKNMGGTGADQGLGVVADATGNVLVTGFFSSTANFNPGGPGGSLTSAGGSDMFVVKYDPSGTFLWAKRGGGTGGEVGSGVAVDATGNVYVTGDFNTTADFNPGGSGGSLTSGGNSDVFVVKYDPTGSFLWAKKGGGTGVEQATGIAVDANDKIFVTGIFGLIGATADFNPGGSGGTITTSGSVDIFVVKYSQPCGTYSSFTQSACNSFVFNGQTYTTSGTYVDTFTSVTNCDSIVTLYLTIGQPTTTTITGNYCNSVTFNGITYTTSGTYTQNYTSASGCDSNFTYNITIGQASPPNQVTQSACDSFVFNGTTYTASGVYTHTFTNASGCDSAVVLNLTVSSFPVASVAQNSATLTANSADSYQWINCNGNTIIPGATGQSYAVTANGSYAVIITTNGCSDTSDCITVTGLSINELGSGNKVQLYPNPTDSKVTIQTERDLKNATIRLVNIVGQSLSEQKNQHGGSFILEMAQYATGVYFVEISEGGKTARIKVVKE